MKILGQSDLRLHLKKEMSIISGIINSIDHKKLTGTIDNKLTKLSPLEFLYAYTNSHQIDPVDRPYRKLIIDMFSSLETAFPGSAFIAGHILVNNSKEKEEWTSSRVDSKHILKSIGTLMSVEELSLLENLVQCGALYKSAHFEDGKNTRDFVLKASDFSKNTLRLDKNFYISRSVKLEKARIVFVDAAFERMSEIECLVNMSRKKNQAIILVARGYMPEVSSTLYHNFLNAGLKIFPVVSEYSDEDPFEMNDLAEIFGTKPILGRISTFEEEKIIELSGVTDAITGCDLELQVAVRNNFKKFDDLVSSMPEQRKLRLLNRNITLVTPPSTTLLEKSRLQKGLFLYRQISREGMCFKNNLGLPLTHNGLQRIFRCVKSFREITERPQTYVKV